MQKRWTIRGVQPEAIDLIQEVRATSGQTLGELVREAILNWYAGPPEAGEGHPELVELLRLLSEQERLFKQLGQKLL